MDGGQGAAGGGGRRRRLGHQQYGTEPPTDFGSGWLTACFGTRGRSTAPEKTDVLGHTGKWAGGTRRGPCLGRARPRAADVHCPCPHCRIVVADDADGSNPARIIPSPTQAEPRGPTNTQYMIVDFTQRNTLLNCLRPHPAPIPV